MKYGVYSIRDEHVGFQGLFVDSTDYTASRGFAYSIQSGLMQFAARDYDLYKLGTFDTESGSCEMLPAPQFVISGRSAKDMFNSKEGSM